MSVHFCNVHNAIILSHHEQVCIKILNYDDEETVVDGPLVERSANEKTLVEGMVSKKWKLINL